jgi:predicted transcriptional regulator
MSGIAPRPQDDVDERLYELELHLDGHHRRKMHFNISPRFPDMRHWETGDELSLAWQHLDAERGVAVAFDGSNVDLDEIPTLLEQSIHALFSAADERVSRRYWNEPAGGHISEVERYVRVRREESKKLTRQDGILHRIAHLVSNSEGTRGAYKWDNSECVGFIHQLRLNRGDPSDLLTGHRWGRQIKSYLPKDPDSFSPGDSLYHPKLGVLFRKSLNDDSAVRWSERSRLQEQLDETIANLLSWAGIPAKSGAPSFVSDDHFDSSARKTGDITLEADPTPQLEAEQEHLLVTALRDLTESDVDVLETLATDGGQPADRLARDTDYSLSTVYRALDRLDGILESDHGTIRFVSQKLAEEIRGIVDTIDRQIEEAANRVGRVYDQARAHSTDSALGKWLARYDAELELDGERPTVRIDTCLSKMRSVPEPRLQDVIREFKQSWISDNRNRLHSFADLWVDCPLRFRDGRLLSPMSAVG